ncbi:hypothetical protein HK104_005142, partial [Borealophlyctis nickersoniae]
RVREEEGGNGGAISAREAAMRAVKARTRKVVEGARALHSGVSGANLGGGGEGGAGGDHQQQQQSGAPASSRSTDSSRPRSHSSSSSPTSSQPPPSSSQHQQHQQQQQQAPTSHHPKHQTPTTTTQPSQNDINIDVRDDEESDVVWVYQSHEPISFRAFFHGWDEMDIVGVENPGNRFLREGKKGKKGGSGAGTGAGVTGGCDGNVLS